MDDVTAPIRRCVRLAVTVEVMLTVAAACLFAGCATLPPGSDYPKTASVALAHPQATQLGAQFAAAARAHRGKFRHFASSPSGSTDS